MKLIRAKASISAVFAVLLTFFSMATYADLCQDCYNAGFNAGEQQCSGSSPSVPNCQEGDYDRGVEDGKNQCPTCPSVPNCQEGDYDRGVEDGKNQCPACATCPNCLEGDYNRGYTDGKNSVTAPNCQEGDYNRGYTDGKDSVTIPDCQANYNQGYQEGYSQGITDGKQQCREDPTVEGCEGLLKSDTQTPEGTKVTQAGIDEGKTQCVINPALCVKQVTEDDPAKIIGEYCQKNKQECGLDQAFDDCKKEGLEEGKNICKKEPEKCFTLLDPNDQAGSIPSNDYDSCNKKNKNCASKKLGQLYLPVVDYVNEDENNIVVIKGVRMDIFVGENPDDPSKAPILFFYKGYAAKTEKLTINQKGEAAGQVISYPRGICQNGSDNDHCEAYYDSGTFVELFAVPQDSDSIFIGWNGDVDCDGKTTNHITVKMNAAKICTATFKTTPASKPQYTLTIVTSGGTGTGTVKSNPTGIDCGSNCTKDYDSGTSVELTATEDTGTFKDWTGDDECKNATENPLTVKMNDDKNCTATFELENIQSSTHTLKIQIGGNKMGTVEWGEDGKCEKNQSPCSIGSSESPVTLTAVPDENSAFNQWVGDCSGKEATTEVTIDKNMICTARFKKSP